MVLPHDDRHRFQCNRRLSYLILFHDRLPFIQRISDISDLFKRIRLCDHRHMFSDRFIESAFSEFLPVGIRTSLRQCRIRKCTRHRRPGTDARTDCKKERFTTRSKPGSCQPADRTDSLERTLRKPPTTGPDRLPQRTIRLAGIRRHPLSSVVYDKRKQYPSPSRHTPHLSGYPEIDPGELSH